MTWTAERHRNAAIDLGLYAVDIVEKRMGLLTASAEAEVNMSLRMAQLHATLALSAKDVLQPTTVNNFSIGEIPADTIFENGYREQ